MVKADGAIVQMESSISEIRFRRNRHSMILGRNSVEILPHIHSKEVGTRTLIDSTKSLKVSRVLKDFGESIFPMISQISDRGHSDRLSSVFSEILRRDFLKSEENQRFLGKYLTMLKGFEFNSQCLVSELLGNHVQVERMDASPTHRVRLPIFSPNDAIARKASHLQISLAAVVMNPEKSRFETQIRHGQHRPLTHLPIIAETISFDIPRKDDAVLCVIVSVRSYKKEGENYQFVEDPKCNASAICYVGNID